MRLREWRRAVAPAVLVLLAGLVAGCATTLPSATTGPGSAAPTMTVPYPMPVVVAMAGFFDDGRLPGLDEEIASFEAANPDVMVELVKAPVAGGERQAAFAEALGKGDSSTDLYVVDTAWLAGFVTKGWLKPLDGYDAAHEVDGAAVEANTVGDRLMGLPFGSGQSLVLSAYSGVPDQAFRVMAYLASNRR